MDFLDLDTVKLSVDQIISLLLALHLASNNPFTPADWFEITVGIFFLIIPYDNRFPTTNTFTINDNNDDIQQLKLKVDKLEQIIMEHHLESVSYTHLTLPTKA